MRVIRTVEVTRVLLVGGEFGLMLRNATVSHCSGLGALSVCLFVCCCRDYSELDLINFRVVNLLGGRKLVESSGRSSYRVHID